LLAYPQSHGVTRAVFGFRANQKSAGKGGRIMRGVDFGFLRGLISSLLEAVFQSRKLGYKVMGYAKFIPIFRM
jgi:hypothetical protein